MASGRLRSERLARLVLLLVIAPLLMAIIASRLSQEGLELSARMPERGGWQPGHLAAEAGVPLELRLTSDDVVHGFAVGQQPWPAVEIIPGQVTEVSLLFDRPGTYTYYCTRWCGPNHWRMRGTIDVNGQASKEPGEETERTPLYVSLGLDIDAPHELDVNLSRPPSAGRGRVLLEAMPATYRDREVYLSQTPFDVWQALAQEPGAADLTGHELWDVVAAIWRSHTNADALSLGGALYSANCAACHGETGGGDGVLGAGRPVGEEAPGAGQPPTDFTDSSQMLGASTALLQGKIVRGGMGTGMPYWGPIFTETEINALVDYIWTFQFPITPEGE
jgi:mono/diheme cytochrome c family protein